MMGNGVCNNSGFVRQSGIIKTGTSTVTVLDPKRLADLAEWLGT